MRPRSVVAPLILVLIGVIFLVNNLWPNLSLWHLVWLYWPFLLIAWGVLRLFEVLVWAFTSRETPVSGISGGEWAIIILICVFGSGGFWVNHHHQNWHSAWAGPFRGQALEVFGQPYDYPVSDQKAVGKKPQIMIENLRGDTRVVAVDTDQIKVEGRKTIRTYSQGDADQANRQSSLRLDVNGNQVYLSTNQERITGDRTVRCDLELNVPMGADIQAHSRSGDFDISGISGNVVINGDNGEARVQDIGGSVRVNMHKSALVRAVGVKGSVELHGKASDVDIENVAGPVTLDGVFTGDQKYKNLSKPLRAISPGTELQVDGVPGQILMDLSGFSGTNLTGPIRLNAKAKDVHLEDFTNAAQISVEKGDISLRPGRLPLASINVHTRTGDVALALPPAAKFELTASTARGEIQNDFGGGLKTTTEGHGASVKGAVGSGPAITLDTTRGSITLGRGELKTATVSKESKGNTVSIETPAGSIKVQRE